MRLSRGVSPTRSHRPRGSGGRAWRAHFEFTPINIEPIILRKKIEDLRILGAFRPRRWADGLWKSPKLQTERASMSAVRTPGLMLADGADGSAPGA
jgi:hypothetical protein